MSKREKTYFIAFVLCLCILAVMLVIQHDLPRDCISSLNGISWHGVRADQNFITKSIKVKTQNGYTIFLREYGIVETALCPVCSKPIPEPKK